MNIRDIIKRLHEHYKEQLMKNPSEEELRKTSEFIRRHGLKGYEIWFCPEEHLYEQVLKMLRKDDVVFDVGAGDLRFSLMMSQKVKKVYAVEINPLILGNALKIIGYDLPANLIVICGNAWKMQLPPDVTCVVCLMLTRHHKFPKHWKTRIIYSTKNGLKILERGRSKWSGKKS